MIKSICVFGGSAEGFNSAYAQAAEKTGELLAKKNIKIIFGGCSEGIMGAVAKSALIHNGHVVGVMPEFMQKIEDTLYSVTQLIITDSMHDRKMQMYNLGDAFLILPGGMGTIDETSEILCWLKLRLHDKKLIIMNIQDYWSPFLKALQHSVDSGFMHPNFLDPLCIVQSVDELAKVLDSLSPEKFVQSQETVAEEIKIALRTANNPIDASVKIQELVATNGFKWDKLDSVIKKITEEISELEKQVIIGDKEKIMEEYGDLLFAIINLSIHLGINYTNAIKFANKKFLQRYSKMEELILQQKKTFKDFQLDHLLNFWDKVKKFEAES